ncbi:MAG: aminotransferase class III-fold pyridoxal phosphate-dependent enzyme [Spirochaetes bacterium]|nr:aminotransferase class III-fold pyridoxal phosphate-dependent enzyme [Spirochaetota bacterium]
MGFYEDYIKRTPGSQKAAERAQAIIPGGVGSAIQFWAPYPIYIKDSKGSRIWDMDGNEYIDYCMCYAAMVAGHANPVIAESIARQAKKGTLYGLPSSSATELAEEIHRRYPAIDMLRFTQSGVEATMYAVRLARAATHKDGVIKVEGAYHGASDVLLVSTAVPTTTAAGPAWMPSSIVESAGIPAGATENTFVVQFNDLESLEYQLKKHEGEIACFILEPCMTNGGVIPPDPGYLKGVRELTIKYNVLLIFDEVKIGARIAPGGGAEKYGITPDLITLAKAIGGGTPLGAFGGRRELMELITPLGPAVHFGTYNANPLTTTAGLTCLKEVLTTEKYKEMDELGEKYASGLEEIISRLNFPASVTHEGPLGGIQFVPEKPHTYREANQCNKDLWKEYWYGMLSKGVIPMGSGWFEEYSISAAHTVNDIEETLNITEDVLSSIKKKLL